MNGIWNCLNAALVSVVLGLLVGCGSHSHPPSGQAKSAGTQGKDNQEAEIQAELAKLAPADRDLATAQKFCPVMEDSRLGAMGEPIKVMVKDKPVFVCCKGCIKKAQREADKTLGKVEELKAKVKATSSKQ